LFGDEDARVLEPAARTLGAAGRCADTVFVRALRGEFDAVLTPLSRRRHDGGEGRGIRRRVNVTLGLPFPRVAPDHGTRARHRRQGVADPGSMRAALELGTDLARRGQRAGGGAALRR